MRIHRIVLRNYRGVNAAEVVLPATGVTIIEGDNEAGKTSLAEALDLIFDFPDSSAHRRVKAVQPVHRDAGAEVEVEVSTGPYRFVYAKRWHRQRATTLDVLEPERVQLTGKDAHDRVEAILAETLDGELWEALRLRQGVALAQPRFHLTSLGRALDAAAGGEADRDSDGHLWGRVGAERDRYWTATGHPRVERTASAKAAEEAHQALEAAEAKLAGLEAATEEMARLTAQARRLEVAQADRAREEVALAERAAAVSRARSEVERLASATEAARAIRDGAAAALERREELGVAVATARDDLIVLEAEVARAEPVRAAARARHGDLAAAHAAARASLDAADLDHRRAVADADHRRHEIELAQLTERHTRVLQAQERLTAADAELDANRVDEAMVRRIEAAHLAVVQAGAAATSGAALVEVTALGDVDLLIEGEPRSLATGRTEPFQVTERFELTVPDHLRVLVHPGGEAQALADRLEQARRELARHCADAQVADLEEARTKAAARQEAERTRAEAVSAVARDLRDLTLDALAHKVGRLAERVDGYARARPPEPAMPTDLDEAQRLAAVAEAAVDRWRDEVARLERELAAAIDGLREAEVGDARLGAQVELARAAVGQAERSLADARAGEADDVLRERLAAAEGDLAQAKAQLAAAEGELAAIDPEGFDELIANARAARERAAADSRANRDRRSELRGRLEAEGELGLARVVDEARSRFEHLELEHERLEARAAAAKLLYDTLAARRDQARQRRVAPFRDRIEQLGRLVFGPTLSVELDDDLRIARRTLEGVTVDFDQLSTGAQEQLGLIARLACAALVATDGGAPVIFDDALGWTDPQRLALMGAVIASAGRDCQVIVLTCTPGRYAAVGSATVLRLPA